MNTKYQVTYTVLGCIVPEDKVFTTQKVRVCQRSMSNKVENPSYDIFNLKDCLLDVSLLPANANFCPFCAIKFFKDKDIRLDNYTQQIECSVENNKAVQASYKNYSWPQVVNNKVILSFVSTEEDENSQYAVGVKIHSNFGPNSIQSFTGHLNTTEMRVVVRSLLIPYGLWNDETFGIHTVNFKREKIDDLK